MILYNGIILVEELQDDLMVNGTAVIYDSDSPYMFCKAINMSKEAIDAGLMNNLVLVIKRYAKEEYLPGSYFISYKDVRAAMSLEDYEKLKVKDDK